MFVAGQQDCEIFYGFFHNNNKTKFSARHIMKLYLGKSISGKKMCLNKFKHDCKTLCSQAALFG